MASMQTGFVEKGRNNTKDTIKDCEPNFTKVEQVIGKFFYNNNEQVDFSSKNISNKLYVSEAALSRFAKKCGFKGYREFVFSYVHDLKEEGNLLPSEKDISIFTRNVQKSYQDILAANFKLLDEEKIRKVASILNEHDRVLVYGLGSSGKVAEEFELRFMRLGLDVSAITDSQVIKMSYSLFNENNVVIAISLSGKTDEILNVIKTAKNHNCKVVYLSSFVSENIEKYCDEVIKVATLRNLDTGTKISPQFSFLVMIDVLYSYYLANNSYFKTQKYQVTLSALKSK